MDDFDRYSADVLDESTLRAPIEIGEELTPWDAFEQGPVRVGANTEIGDAHGPGGSYSDQFLEDLHGGAGHDEIGQYELGLYDALGANIEIGNGEIVGAKTEIGAALAIREVLKTARDSRKPAPPMKAVAMNAPERRMDSDWALMDTCIGAAAAPGTPGPYPLLTEFMQRCGTGLPARIVRVDTQESYDAFRAAGSPEMQEYRQRIDELSDKLASHTRDPYAHQRIADEIDDLTFLGAEADAALAEKSVALQLPPSYRGKVDSWIDEDDIFASISVPHKDGTVWWLTSAEPVEKSVSEASRHAANAGVPASAVLPALVAIGEVLGAGTAIKEMVAATPAILQVPAAQGCVPFMIRIEPKGNPAICGLAALACACRAGNSQACDEWNRLAAAAPAQVKQAMNEALELLKRAA
jgi:hypothetical protein